MNTIKNTVRHSEKRQTRPTAASALSETPATAQAELQELVAQLGTLSSLKLLDLGANGLTALPGPLLAKLTSLEELRAANNTIASAPPGGAWRHSGRVSICGHEHCASGCSFQAGSCDAGLELHAASRTAAVRTSLLGLPAELGALKLRKLDLSGNAPTALPAGLEHVPGVSAARVRCQQVRRWRRIGGDTVFSTSI